MTARPLEYCAAALPYSALLCSLPSSYPSPCAIAPLSPPLTPLRVLYPSYPSPCAIPYSALFSARRLRRWRRSSSALLEAPRAARYDVLSLTRSP